MGIAYRKIKLFRKSRERCIIITVIFSSNILLGVKIIYLIDGTDLLKIIN